MFAGVRVVGAEEVGVAAEVGVVTEGGGVTSVILVLASAVRTGLLPPLPGVLLLLAITCTSIGLWLSALAVTLFLRGGVAITLPPPPPPPPEAALVFGFNSETKFEIFTATSVFLVLALRTGASFFFFGGGGRQSVSNTSHGLGAGSPRVRDW